MPLAPILAVVATKVIVWGIVAIAVAEGQPQTQNLKPPTSRAYPQAPARTQTEQ